MYDFDARFVLEENLPGCDNIFKCSRRTDNVVFLVKITDDDCDGRVELEMNLRLRKMPGIEKLVTHFIQNQLIYLVMEYDPAKIAIDDYMGDELLDENMAKLLFLQMYTIVDRMRDAQLFNGDIKVSNALVHKDTLRVTLIDFEHVKPNRVGKVFNFSKRLTASGKSVFDPLELEGTVDYLPPEVFKTGRFRADHVSVYALGVSLFYMVTGKCPRDKDLVPSDMVNITPDLFDLLLKMLEPDPRKRLAFDDIEWHPWIGTEFWEGL